MGTTSIPASMYHMLSYIVTDSDLFQANKLFNNRRAAFQYQPKRFVHIEDRTARPKVEIEVVDLIAPKLALLIVRMPHICIGLDPLVVLLR